MLAQAVPARSGDFGDVPAALAAFLGEAPSEAAIRRPSTAASQVRPPSSAARRNPEDSSPDSEGLPPENDGGFDDFRDDAPVPSMPEAEAYASKSSKSASHRDKAVSSPNRTVGYPEAQGGKRPNVPRAPSKEGSAPPKSFATTCTPGPGALSSMLGEAPAAAAMRRGLGSGGGGSGGGALYATSGSSSAGGGAGDTASSLASSMRSQSSSHGPNARSNSLHRGGRGAREPSNTPKGAGGVLELDPLGSTSKRRFGGRG
mmetsp:Transcript_31632/g.58123  ORF Transcript_31632/g.58123 Transcript_31632/m.58123 type:complete len:259 (+) Transcript_31632:58-834(+)